MPSPSKRDAPASESRGSYPCQPLTSPKIADSRQGRRDRRGNSLLSRSWHARAGHGGFGQAAVLTNDQAKTRRTSRRSGSRPRSRRRKRLPPPNLSSKSLPPTMFHHRNRRRSPSRPSQPELLSKNSPVAAAQPSSARARTEPAPVVRNSRTSYRSPEPVHASEPECPNRRRNREPEPKARALKEFVTDLESSLGESFLPGTVAKPVEPVNRSGRAVEPAVAAASTRAGSRRVRCRHRSLSRGRFPVAAPVPEASLGCLLPAAAVPAHACACEVAPLAASAAASASRELARCRPRTSRTSPHRSAAASPAAPSPVAMPSLRRLPSRFLTLRLRPQASPFAEEAGVDLGRNVRRAQARSRIRSRRRRRRSRNPLQSRHRLPRNGPA